MYLANDCCDILSNHIFCSLYAKTFIDRESCDVIF